MPRGDGTGPDGKGPGTGRGAGGCSGNRDVKQENGEAPREGFFSALRNSFFRRGGQGAGRGRNQGGGGGRGGSRR